MGRHGCGNGATEFQAEIERLRSCGPPLAGSAHRKKRTGGSHIPLIQFGELDLLRSTVKNALGEITERQDTIVKLPFTTGH